MNTEKSKSLISEAIRNLSSDFALSDARALLSRALSEIQHVENKREKRSFQNKPIAEARVATTSSVAKQSPAWTRDQVTTTINIIDKMIAEEKQKLDDMKKPKVAQQTIKELDDLING